MTQVGEGVAVTTVKEKKPGELRVQVRDSCSHEVIEGTEVSVGSKSQTTDNSGEVVFTELPEGAVGAQAKLHSKDADYATFVIHYPRIIRKFEAKTTASESADVPAGGKAKIRIYIEVYKVIDEVVFHRKHIDFNGEDKYGHWWSVFGPNMSFGWWPKYPVGHPANRQSEPPVEPAPLPADADWKASIAHRFAKARYAVLKKMFDMKESSVAHTFRGVEGELNGKTMFGGVARPGRYIDPHHKHGDVGDERYSPVRKDCFELDSIRKEAESFANSYSGGWSWRLEFGNHCHTFQKQLMNEVGAKKVKVIS